MEENELRTSTSAEEKSTKEYKVVKDSVQVDVTMKSTWIYVIILLVIWTRCYTTGSNIPRRGSRSTEMTLSCFSTTDPESVNLTHIYNGLEDTGSLWRGQPSDMVGCSNTRPPDPYRCVPCFVDRIVHVICMDIPERFELVMEAVGELILSDFNEDSRCPTIIEPSVSGGQVIGSYVRAKVGDDVTLPCHIEPPVDPSRMTVEWTRPDQEPEFVQILRDGRVISDDINLLYQHRAYLFHDQLSRGNISLKLFRVKLSDQGTYKCFVPHLASSSLIQLNVGIVIHQRGEEEKGPTAGVVAGIVTTVTFIILVPVILGYLYWKKNNTGRARVRYQQQNEEQITLQDPSPKPRKRPPVSKRWKQQLEKLANADDCKVTKVGSLLFCKDEEFCITKGRDGTQVFLGFRDDGTEVAIKRISRLNLKVLEKEEEFLRLPKLDHPSIVRYVDYAEDEDFGYLALQLCEYSLAEYITEHNPSELERNELAHQVLQSLSVLHGQNPTILHRDIKPQNVLIDIQNRARLADFGMSRQLSKGQTSVHTGRAGTSRWTAIETLGESSVVIYKRSTDIQVTGMLIYYILSGGEHPFGTGARCEANILDGKYNLDHVQDVVAKDLIERMINGNSEERPTVEECLAHPFFWSIDRKVEYLRRIGKEVENSPDDDKDLITVLDQYAEQGQFTTWKHKFPPELLQKMRSYPENSFGLLRFIEHHAEETAGVNLMEMFPDLFGCVYQFAQEQRWNSRPTLKIMFHTQDVFTSSV